MSTLESSKWLLYLSGLLKASLVVANAVDLERRPVLVHCSDGWDRTPQIVALAELMLDPYYRTIEGFEVLVEKEWLEFGHKFGDRCGNGVSAEDVSERCPVFLQWLDCVHQLLSQFPCSFQFNQQFLVKLAQHTYSCLFGNFLGNSVMERQREGVAERTFSVWCFLRARPEQFRNYLYSHTDQVLRPQSQVRDLRLWSEVYLQPAPCTSALSGAPPATPPSESQEAAEETPPEPAGEPSPQTNLAKTKSVDSLYAGPDTQAAAPDRHQRRLSDSSLKGFPMELHSHEDAACQPSPSKHSCPDLVSEPSPGGPAVVSGSGAEDDGPREGPANEAPSIDGSTDTLVNEIGQQSSSVGADDGVLQKTMPEPAELSPAQLDQQLSNTASTSTTDLRSSAGAVLGGGYSELPLEEVAPGKCVVCLSRKNGHENLLAATRSSLARSAAAATTNGGRFSHYSTPMHSRTPSSGFPATPCDDRLLLDPMASRTQSSQASCQQQFDVDGLNTPVDALQQRIHQMVLDHEAKIENLENELRRARFALDQRSLHHNGKEASEALEDALGLDCACSGEPPWGGCQDGSSSSELSWEQVDEREARATLWVPDHAASHCTACGAEFWIGRRKHHCRNCGNVFCSQCASQMHPVPHEQLYQPVRVCSSCFEALRSRPCRPSALLAAPGPHPERILAKTSPAVTAASN
uniref:Lateral signaling target protein 2 homolog n=1 Tax=Ixodes scapularis TaxID=6945 RepID=A0A4D5RPK6_IXOSC